MIIWLASYPRSGNNLTRIILRRVYKVKTYAIYDEPPQPRLDIEAARDSKDTFLVKTHDLPEDDSPAIYLVRDGRDALVSYAHYIYIEQNFRNSNLKTNILIYPHYLLYCLQYLKSKTTDDFWPFWPFHVFAAYFRRRRVQPPSSLDLRHILHDLITYDHSFGGWGPNVQAWTQRRAPTRVLKFEALLQNSEPEVLIRTQLEALGYELGPAVNSPKSFTELRRRRPDLYRKGQIGSHKNEMPEDLESLFWQRNGPIMELMGYSR